MKNKDLSVINSIATFLIAYFLTVPVHELFHVLTHLAYGSHLTYYSAGAVNAIVTVDYSSLPAFHRIMLAGGSASILNMIIAVVLMIILLKVKMGSMTRLFLTQLMGAQAVQGIGYFLIGGMGIGDWGNVFNVLPDMPGLVTALRIILLVLGAAGIVGLMFLLNHLSYYFIQDQNDKKERRSVGFKLHMIPFIIGIILGPIITVLSPAVKSGELSLGLSLLFDLMWMPFFWGFMFTGFMVKPPKKSRFLYPLPPKPNFVLLVIGIILILVDIIVFGPGIQFS